MAEPTSDTVFDLNFRIISCRKLLIGDRTSSDPYVKILLGKKELHRTKHLLKTLNPVFEEKDNHTFSAKINYGELTAAGGIFIEVKDWDRVGTNDLIGLATIDPARVLGLARMGKPTSIKLEVPKGRKETDAGFITLCIQDPGAGMDSDSDDDSSAGPAKAKLNSKNDDDSGSDSDSENALGNTAVPAAPVVAATASTRTRSSTSKTPSISVVEPPDATILELNISIMSCRKLLKGDRNSSDPYVKIMLGTKELHRTKYILKTLDPLFSARHENKFSGPVRYGDIVEAGGIDIEVKDWDRVGTSDLIGIVTIEPKLVLQLAKTGKPTTLDLDVPPGRKETEAGSITLCIQDTRMADDSDEEEVKQVSDKLVVPLPKMDFRPSFGAEAAGRVPPAGTYDKELFIEIMSCKGLIGADMNGLSDPYVVLKLGNTVLHKTLWIEDSLNPAFSIDHKNTYILTCSAEELWAHGGLEVVVMDHDVKLIGIGMSDDEIGYVKIPPKKLYDSTGEYAEFKLNLPRNPKIANGQTKAGSIALRVREAKLEDKDAKAAAEVAAISGGRDSPLMDDTADWEAEAGFSTIKPRKEKVYVDDDDEEEDDNSDSSSDMYMDDSGDETEKPKTKPAKKEVLAASTSQSAEDMPKPTELEETTSSKWGNQKGVAGGPGRGAGGRGGGVVMQTSQGGRGALYVPSIHPGDMFEKEIEKHQEKHHDTSDDDDSVLADAEVALEQLVEKDARINELEQEAETLKEQNAKLRAELNKMRYRLKANKPAKSKKVPLAKQRSNLDDEEDDEGEVANEEEAKRKVEEEDEKAGMPASALKKGKFNVVDFGDGPSDDDEDEEPTPKKGGFGALDFGLEAPSFSSDEEDENGKAPSRGIPGITSVVSEDSRGDHKAAPVLSPSPNGNKLLAPTQGIPGVRLSEMASPSPKGVRFQEKSRTYSTDDDDDDSDEEDGNPQRGLLSKMGLTSSVIGRASLFSFVNERPDDPNNQAAQVFVENKDGLVDFDRKNKDMQFAKLDFVGVASRDGGIKAMPSLAVNTSAILAEDDDSDVERKKSMIGVAVDKEWSKTSSSRSLQDFLDDTPTTMVKAQSTQVAAVTGRRIVELEQQVQELREELELALANPGGYEKVALEVQLRVAQDNSKKLEKANDLLQRMNKIQKEALFELSARMGGVKNW